MKPLILTTLLLATALTTQAQCLATLEKAAIHAMALETKQNVADIFLVRSEMQAWTEATGNNTGSAEIALRTKKVSSQTVYLQVFAKQIHSSDKCKVVKLAKIPASSINPLALKAEKYRIAIGTALHISEGDSEWTPAYFHSNVIAFDENQIAEALNAAAPLDIFSKELTLSFLSDYATDNDFQEDRAKYAALLKLLKKDFKDFRLIKVGEPDSGGLDLYLLGITPEGQLVGLRAITIET